MPVYLLTWPARSFPRPSASTKPIPSQSICPSTTAAPPTSCQQPQRVPHRTLDRPDIRLPELLGKRLQSAHLSTDRGPRVVSSREFAEVRTTTQGPSRINRAPAVAIKQRTSTLLSTRRTINFRQLRSARFPNPTSSRQRLPDRQARHPTREPESTATGSRLAITRQIERIDLPVDVLYLSNRSGDLLGTHRVNSPVIIILPPYARCHEEFAAAHFSC
jgi:hypothetical protein